jgi:hypothetical protein
MSINVSFYFLFVDFGLLGELEKQKQLILIIILFLLIPIEYVIINIYGINKYKLNTLTVNT